MDLKGEVLAVACILLAVCAHAQTQLIQTASAAAGNSTLDPNLEQKPVLEQLMARKQALLDHLKGEAFQRC
jgi:hypothetical protein